MKQNFSKHQKAIERRKRVITRLEAQLKSGVKNIAGFSHNHIEELSEKDIKRIKKELETLKKRI